MPIYDFRIVDDAGAPTNKTVELFFPAGQRPDETIVDGKRAIYDIRSTLLQQRTQASHYECEFHPLSVDPRDVGEARRANPEMTYRDDGTCIATSHNEVKRLAKAAGLVDRSKTKLEKHRKTLMRISHRRG